MYRDTPGLAADLAVFDVILRVATAGIQADRVLFTTIRTQDSTAGIGCAIAEWKVAIEVELVVVVVVECKAHSENVRMVHRCHPRFNYYPCPICSPPGRRWQSRSASISSSPSLGLHFRC